MEGIERPVLRQTLRLSAPPKNNDLDVQLKVPFFGTLLKLITPLLPILILKVGIP